MNQVSSFSNEIKNQLLESKQIKLKLFAIAHLTVCDFGLIWDINLETKSNKLYCCANRIWLYFLRNRSALSNWLLTISCVIADGWKTIKSLNCIHHMRIFYPNSSAHIVYWCTMYNVQVIKGEKVICVAICLINFQSLNLIPLKWFDAVWPNLLGFTNGITFL